MNPGFHKTVGGHFDFIFPPPISGGNYTPRPLRDVAKLPLGAVSIRVGKGAAPLLEVLSAEFMVGMVWVSFYDGEQFHVELRPEDSEVLVRDHGEPAPQRKPRVQAAPPAPAAPVTRRPRVSQ